MNYAAIRSVLGSVASARWLRRSLVGRVFALYVVTLLAFVGGGVGMLQRSWFRVDLDVGDR